MSKSNYSLIWNGFDSNRIGYEMIPFYRTVTGNHSGRVVSFILREW